MNNGEFYSSREHNYIGENRNFPAELYRKPFEENPLGSELADLGQETTTLGNKQPTSKAGGDGGTKTLVEQVFNSIRSVATAAVAVSAIVVTGSVMSSTASANLISIDVGSSYVEYEMEISDSTDDLFVILEAPGEKLSETEITEGGVHQGRVEGLKPEWEYVLSLVTRDPVLGDITRFQHKFQTEKHQEYVPDPPNSTASITAVTLADINLVRVDFDTENVERLTLRIGYPDGEWEDIELTPENISSGFALVSIPDTALAFEITPIIVFDGKTVEGEKFEATFENNLEVYPVVRLYEANQEILFNIKAITNGATYLRVESSAEHPATGDYYFNDTLFYTERQEMTFTVYLTDDTGAILSNQINLTIDTSSVESVPEYDMIFSNPRELGITYNKDGSINIYVYTNFECADESYFCMVTLDKYRAVGREKLLVFENLPNATYGLNYDICFEKDGVIYSVMSYIPSGAVGEIGFYEHYELVENELVLSLSDEKAVDLNSLRLLSSSGEEIIVKERDFVRDEDGHLTLRVSFSEPPELVTLYCMYAPFIHGMEFVGEYEGSIYTPLEIEILPY